MNKREINRKLEQVANDLVSQHGSKIEAHLNVQGTINDFMIEHNDKVVTLLGLMNEDEKQSAFQAMNRQGLDRHGFVSLDFMYQRIVKEYVTSVVLGHLFNKYKKGEQ